MEVKNLILYFVIIFKQTHIVFDDSIFILSVIRPMFRVPPEQLNHVKQFGVSQMCLNHLFFCLKSELVNILLHREDLFHFFDIFEVDGVQEYQGLIQLGHEPIFVPFVHFVREMPFYLGFYDSVYEFSHFYLKFLLFCSYF